MANNITEKLDNLVSVFEKQRQLFIEKAREEFKTVVKSIFQQIPEIKVVTWVQYTPYFNDGDTCTFSVGDIVFSNIDPSEADLIRWGEYDGDDESVFVYPTWSKEEREKVPLTDEQKAILDSFVDVCSSGAFEDVMLLTFEDHVRVVGTKDGFEVEEYEHD